jgi:GNAT superfamily N-acetyltransferase
MVHAVATEAAVFSPLDSERFGVRAGRAHVSQENLPHVLEFCAAEKINLLIARCAAQDLNAVQKMEARGFLLMDALIYYSFDLSKKAIPEPTSEFLVRPARPVDKDQIRNIASAAFHGYHGHYHADPRLDRRKCDEAYASWAERSAVLKTAADEVLVAELAAAQSNKNPSNNIAGFATLRLNSSEEGEGPLVAVAPEQQKHGVCRELMIHCLRWCHSQGAGRMVISTQITNIPMQKVWCRVGFEPSSSYFTFHKWFDS